MIDGDVENGSLMAGQSVGLVDKVQPLAEILAELVAQAVAALEREPAFEPTAARRRRNDPRHLGPERPAAAGGRAPRRRAVRRARRLLRRLVQVMASTISPQERLDRMVRMIAADIVAEVCSAYVMRGGEYLELFATEGLRHSAVHQTRLRVGEGLVGLIAAQGSVINLPDAQSHPDFAYRPETGEEIYHSFLGRADRPRRARDRRAGDPEPHHAGTIPTRRSRRCRSSRRCSPR